jgi:hypothetical protein
MLMSSMSSKVSMASAGDKAQDSSRAKERRRALLGGGRVTSRRGTKLGVEVLCAAASLSSFGGFSTKTRCDATGDAAISMRPCRGSPLVEAVGVSPQLLLLVFHCDGRDVGRVRRMQPVSVCQRFAVPYSSEQQSQGHGRKHAELD